MAVQQPNDTRRDAAAKNEIPTRDDAERAGAIGDARMEGARNFQNATIFEL